MGVEMDLHPSCRKQLLSVLVVSLSIVLFSACASRATEKASVGLRVAPPPDVELVFNHGQFRLAPTKAPSSDAAQKAAANIGRDNWIRSLTQDGYTPLVQYALFTNETMGTTSPGVTPEEAAKGAPPDPNTSKIYLTYDHTPAWIARATVPESYIGNVALGPPGPSSGSTNPNAPVTMLFVFTVDGAKQLELLTFPPDG